MSLQPNEYHPFYQGYVERVRDENIGELLAVQGRLMSAFIRDIPAEKGTYRYADGKWTVKQLLQHVIDSERVFAYRLLRIARGDETPMPGFDENNYANAASAEGRSLADIAMEFEYVRNATTSLYQSLGPEDLAKWGTASDAPVTARALGYLITGHCKHHLAILKERYHI